VFLPVPGHIFQSYKNFWLFLDKRQRNIYLSFPGMGRASPKMKKWGVVKKPVHQGICCPYDSATNIATETRKGRPMKNNIRLLLIALCCMTGLFGTGAQAYMSCFCDATGCSSGDGKIVPKASCDTVNGKPRYGTTTAWDRELHKTQEKPWGDDPAWVDVDVWVETPRGPNFENQWLKKKEKELTDVNKKLADLDKKHVNLKIKFFKFVQKNQHQSYDEWKKDAHKRNEDAKEESNNWSERINEFREEYAQQNKDRADKQRQSEERREYLEKKIADMEKAVTKVSGDHEKTMEAYEELSLAQNDLLNFQLNERVFDFTTPFLQFKKDEDTLYAAQAEVDIQRTRTENELEMADSMNDEQKQQHNEGHEQAMKTTAYKEAVEAEMGALRAKKSELENTITRMRGQRNKKTRHQNKAGSAPDASRYADLKNIRVYSNLSGSHFDDDRGTGSKGDSQNLSLGVDIRLGERFSIAPNLAYSNSDTDDDNGGGSKSESYTGGLGFFWGPFDTDDIWFDGSLSYTDGEIDSVAVGAAGQVLKTIEYGTESWNVGIGLNGLKPVSKRLQLEGRLGWSGTTSKTGSFVDTVNIRHEETDNHFHRLSLGGRAVRHTDWGQLNCSATSQYVPYDNTSANHDEDPWDLVLGVGALYRVNDRVSLTGQVGGTFGREDYKEYNASLNLQTNF
jgi:hypothetical protein